MKVSSAALIPCLTRRIVAISPRPAVRGTRNPCPARVSLVTTFADFCAMAAPGRLVPVWHDCLLDLDTPVSAFAKLRRGPFAFLLESAPPAVKRGRATPFSAPNRARRGGCVTEV